MESRERLVNLMLVKRLIDGGPVDGRNITAPDLEKIASSASEESVLEAKLAAAGLLGQVAAHAYADTYRRLSVVLEQ